MIEYFVDVPFSFIAHVPSLSTFVLNTSCLLSPHLCKYVSTFK